MRSILWKAGKSQEKTLQDIPIHNHVYRGWDHSNLKWQNVVWPELDCKLQPLRGKSTAAVRLDWQGGKAQNAVTKDSQGSLTETGTGSSIADKEQTNDPGSSGTAVKLDKGKAKEVAQEV
jgi:hypothetical protein